MHAKDGHSQFIYNPIIITKFKGSIAMSNQISLAFHFANFVYGQQHITKPRSMLWKANNIVIYFDIILCICIYFSMNIENLFLAQHVIEILQFSFARKPNYNLTFNGWA